MAQNISLINDLNDNLDSLRQLAIKQYRADLQPGVLLARLCQIADDTLFKLLAIYPLPQNACLVAVGGYGRGELYPGSDLDILIILDTDPNEHEQLNIQGLIAALWDVGLEPGHSVRTIKQCLDYSAKDITIQTSLLESRFLAGNQQLYLNFELAMAEQLNIQDFFLDKLAEMRTRHAHYKNTAYALEPNCKESPGALRDLQILLWLAKASGYADDWQSLANSGLLNPNEFKTLDRAYFAFQQLRIELHLLSQRAEDRLLFDLQQPIAKIYGFKDQKNRRASEILMQRYYWAAKVVSQINKIVIQLIEEKIFPENTGAIINLDADFQLQGKLIAIRHDQAFKEKPELLLKIFLKLQQTSQAQGMTAMTLRALWHGRKLIDSKFRNNTAHQKIFLEILQQPKGIVEALYEMNLWNILPRFIPVFRKIAGQMQHDLVHIYTVDQHILRVISILWQFTQEENASEFPLASQLIVEFEDIWLLYLAALFHDIAKGRGGDHSSLGARDIKNFACSNKLSSEQTDFLVFLVQEHLTMSTTAQKKDLSDPEVIHNFASCVANKYRLIGLYLLTVADICGTNPSIWNTWKGKLLENLYYQTLNALGTSQPDSETIIAQRKSIAGKIIAKHGIAPAAVQEIWADLDIAYFLRHDPQDIAWHTICLYQHTDNDQPFVKTRVMGANEALQILVYSPDRPDLFLDICSYFDKHQISIQDARIHTTKKAWALDSFIVLLSENNYALQAKYVEQGLLQTMLASKRRAISYRRVNSRRAQIFPISPKVSLETINNGKYCRLSLVTTDRVGLLYDLSLAFNQHRASLVMAKIMTLGDRVEDVFILSGAIVNDISLQSQLERHILRLLNNSQP